MINGFNFVSGKDFFNPCLMHNSAEIKKFIPFFEKNISQDPFSEVRDRGYIKLSYDVEAGQVEYMVNNSYFQTKSSNSIDGGAARDFFKIYNDLIKNKLFHYMMEHNKKYINKYAIVNNKKY